MARGVTRRAAAPAAAATAFASPAEATDAELARRCDAYLAAMDAYNAHPDGFFESAAGNALWVALEAAEGAVLSLPPAGLAGVLALARTAAALAQMPGGQGELWANGPAETFAVATVKQLLALAQRGALP